jgi:hypothetical protein
MLAACLVAVSFATALAAAALTSEDVYHGDMRRYSKPAEVNAKKVFKVIPAYKEILDKKITEDSAVYLIKLAEANKVFSATLAAYAEDNGYDLICEEGHIANAPNATDDVVKLIEDAAKEDKEPK